jgi:NAD(P) transhydrogenase
VALIERNPQVGGNCTHWGTIPSKALRHSVDALMKFNRTPMFRHIAQPQVLDVAVVMTAAQSVMTKQVGMRSRFYARNRVKLYQASAQFVDAHSLRLTECDEAGEVITAERIIIATGSRPYRPPEVDFTQPNVYDSDKVLSMQTTPKRLIIFGAGVIGCEYASIFSGLGVKVDLVNPSDRLLAFMDDEISDALSYHMRANGVTIRHGESFKRLETSDQGVVLHTESGKKIKAEAFLWANGRAGNTEDLNLEAIGLVPNKRGQLEVNQRYQTEVPSVYAVGDVIGWPSLASAGYDQGRSAAAAALGAEEVQYFEDIPTGIYTIPEISSVGLTERELTAQKVPYEVGKAYFKDTARAQITGEEAGVLKLLFHRETLELLGIHCFGDQAAEILHIGQAIFAQPNGQNTLEYFVNHTFNYPTMAEAYRVAALNGLNRL